MIEQTDSTAGSHCTESRAARNFLIVFLAGQCLHYRQTDSPYRQTDNLCLPKTPKLSGDNIAGFANFCIYVTGFGVFRSFMTDSIRFTFVWNNSNN